MYPQLLQYCQRVVESILQGIPGLAVYLEDILMSGKNEKHLLILNQLLDSLEVSSWIDTSAIHGLLSGLGHIVDAQGLRPDPDKVRAIINALWSRSVSELKSYLRLLAYHSTFFTDLATVLASLSYALTHHGLGTKEEEAFVVSKQILTSAVIGLVLVHFILDLPLLLACDASSYCIGAVLSHQLPGGLEHPIDHLHTRPKEFHTYYVTSGGACQAILCTVKTGKMIIPFVQCSHVSESCPLFGPRGNGVTG